MKGKDEDQRKAVKRKWRRKIFLSGERTRRDLTAIENGRNRNE
jgi:hypothetical protein